MGVFNVCFATIAELKTKMFVILFFIDDCTFHNLFKNINFA